MRDSIPGVKTLLEQPPLLSPSKEGEELFIYLVVPVTVVSVALIREKNKIQLQVYYINQAF